MPSESELRCTFCKQVFRSERRLHNHLCEPKRRHQQRDEKGVHLGFLAYQQALRSMRRKRPPTYDDFAESDLYSAFVRFGKHLVNLNAINPPAFVEFLLRNQAKIDQWTSQRLYATYIREMTRTEPPLEAIERTFKLMQQWAQDKGSNWTDYFRCIEPAYAVLLIIAGRISPWILFTASSAHDLIARMTPEQIKLMHQSIDADYWHLKLTKHQQEVEDIRTMLDENEI